MLPNPRRVALALVSACAIFGLHIGGAAAVPVTVTVDENCHGTAATPTMSLTLNCPGTATVPVIYVLPLPAGSTLTDGDLILAETSTGPISDLIRFTHAGPSSTPVIVFFSDTTPGDPAPSLADIGFPAPQANVLARVEIGSEGNNGFTYTPTSGQPGFVSGNNLQATYVIRSDVPEPGTLLLLGLALAGLGIAWPRAAR